MAIVVTYDVPSESFEVTGGTSSTPATMNDIYSYAYNNSLYISGEPVVETWSGATYRLRANINFGDESTSTYFTSLNEMVYFEDGYVFAVKSAATLQIGELSGNWGINGSLWSIDTGVGTHRITATGNPTFLMYASTLHARSKNDNRFDVGTITILNSTLSSTTTDDLSIFWFVGGTVTLKRVHILNTHGFAANVDVDLDDVFIHEALIGVSGIGTLINVTVSNASENDLLNISSGDLILVNPGFSVSGLQINDPNGTAQVRYTINLTVNDHLGMALESATVMLMSFGNIVSNDGGSTFYRCIVNHTAGTFATDITTGKWELTTAANATLAGVDGTDQNGAWITAIDYVATAEVFSMSTDTNGNITEQIETYKQWVGTSEALLSYSPHILTISKVGYATLTTENVILDTPLVWTQELQNIPIGASAKNQFSLEPIGTKGVVS